MMVAHAQDPALETTVIRRHATRHRIWAVPALDDMHDAVFGTRTGRFMRSYNLHYCRNGYLMEGPQI